MADSIVVNEIYLSLQGESSWSGLPCVFVRLTACDLRCTYCDTAYAFTEGTRRPLDEVLERIELLAAPYRGVSAAQRLPLVELTGGEPLLQHGSLALMVSLCDRGYTVLLETSGAHDVSRVDPRVHRIMDLKCPSSGESGRNRVENLVLLTPRDEVKFVIGTWEDYTWMSEQIRAHELARRCPLLVSWVHPLSEGQRHPSLKKPPPGHRPISRQELAEQLIADALPVRFQAQLHKLIWSPESRGV